VHAVVLFRGKKGGYLVTTNGCFLGIRSEAVSSLWSGPRLFISDNEAPEGTCSSAELKQRSRSPQGPTIVGTGNGTPEVPELPSAWGYSWATLSGGYKYEEIECWRGPAANLLHCTEAVQVTNTNDRPDLSSEGAPDIDKTVTVKQ
jgi:hypothetical protein